MARIKNIDLPKEKRTVIGLTYIFGIGNSRAKKICKAANVSEDIRIKDLSTEQINALRKEVDKYTVTGDLKRDIQMNIKNKMEIGCYQGDRHKKKLPVRGQNTKSNARTHKGKAVAIANKKK